VVNGQKLLGKVLKNDEKATKMLSPKQENLQKKGLIICILTKSNRSFGRI